MNTGPSLVQLGIRYKTERHRSSESYKDEDELRSARTDINLFSASTKMETYLTQILVGLFDIQATLEFGDIWKDVCRNESYENT